MTETLNATNTDSAETQILRYRFGVGVECMIDSSCSLTGHISVGRNTFIGPDCQLSGGAPIIIGSFCRVEGKLRIATAGTMSPNTLSSSEQSELTGSRVVDFTQMDSTLKAHSVNIGNGVYIGKNVTVSGGVTIGDGCVIRSHSVVLENCEPYSIYSGIGNQDVCKRFPDYIIEELLETQWTWPIETLLAYIDCIGVDLLPWSGTPLPTTKTCVLVEI